MTTLLKAFDDPRLFGPEFRLPAWASWRAFLAALTAEPMTDAELALYRACTGRTVPPAAPFRECAVIVGRRGGKSRCLALIAVYLATFRDYAPYLAAGEVATIAVLARNRSQARSIFRFISGLLKAVEPLAEMMEDENTEQITLNNRVVIEISTASFRTTRGYSFAAVLCDEIAFWSQDETSSNPDTEILRALRPGLASIPGSILLMASSPYAKRGELYNSFRRYHGVEGARVLVWKAPTLTMNTKLDPAEVAREYEDDPESARAEYGAEFRDDLADFVTREVVDAVTMWGRTELPPMPGIAYTAFCDPSGGASDAMTLAIGHMGGGNVAVVDAIREARPPFDPEQTVAEFAVLLRKFNISRIVGDKYAGEWPRQRFREHGINYDASARPKSDLYIDLLPLLNAGRVELLDSRRLSAQLVGLERRTARSGRDLVDHSPGGHDDLANAAAGVIVGLDLDRRPSLIPSSALLAEPVGEENLRLVTAVYAMLWIGIDGMAGWCMCALRVHSTRPLIIVDYDIGPWSSSVLDIIANRLDHWAEVARDGNARSKLAGVSAWLFCPAQVEDAAGRAMAAAFLARQGRADARLRRVAAEAIDAAYLADAEQLAFGASAHVTAGLVGLSAHAAEKSASVPLLGVLSVPPGARVEADPLRLATLLAISMGLDREPSHRPAAIPAARVAFG